jgi:hypothetical protein
VREGGWQLPDLHVLERPDEAQKTFEQERDGLKTIVRVFRGAMRPVSLPRQRAECGNPAHDETLIVLAVVASYYEGEQYPYSVLLELHPPISDDGGLGCPTWARLWDGDGDGQFEILAPSNCVPRGLPRPPRSAASLPDPQQ